MNADERQMLADAETEEQVAARIRLVSARKALAYAPELAYQLRWDAVPLDGRTERGIIPELRTPLLTGLTDAADELFVLLQAWVDYWADQLGVARSEPEGFARNLQASHKSAGYRDGERIGFRAGTSPETASILVSSKASWLLWHEEAIASLEHAGEFHDDVAGLVWSLRAAAGLIRPHRRSEVATISTRPCPACNLDEVRVEYFGEPMVNAIARGERLSPTPIGSETEDQAANYFASAIAGVNVRCAYCGWAPELRPSKIARWLS